MTTTTKSGKRLRAQATGPLMPGVTRKVFGEGATPAEARASAAARYLEMYGEKPAKVSWAPWRR